MNLCHAALLLPALLLGQGSSDWDKPFPPHKVAGNLYYVGTRGLSSYLITTPQGHILINSSFERTVPTIRKAVEELGFKFSDIKILLTSHAHDDHAAGTALVKELTGAKIMVMQGDENVVENGGRDWKPCKVDRVLKDRDEVKLGGATLTALLTPGHTPGCTTWTMKVREQNKDLFAVIVGSPNVNPGYQLVNNTKYPTIAEDFAKSFNAWKALKADIFLGAHGDYYGLAGKYEKLKKGGVGNPFVDPDGYKAYIAEREQAYLKTLAQQKQAAGK